MVNDIQQKLYNEAVAFFEFAECGRKNIPEQKHIESYIPYIINMTFCSELLLKFLLIKKGQNIESVEKLGHNLKSLYEELEPDTRQKIYLMFKRPMIYTIDEELECIKKAFVDWRYLVLNKAKGSTKKLQIHPFFLKELNEVLLEYCKQFI